MAAEVDATALDAEEQNSSANDQLEALEDHASGDKADNDAEISPRDGDEESERDSRLVSTPGTSSMEEFETEEEDDPLIQEAKRKQKEEEQKGRLSLKSVLKLRSWLTKMRIKLKTPPWQPWLEDQSNLVEWPLVHALRSRRSLNLSSTDFFLQNLVQLNYFQVLHYNLMHEFLACDLISYSPGDRITPNVHLTRVDSLPRSFGSPLEARRQLAMLCYSVNRLGKLLMTRIRDNLLQSTASGGSAVLGGPPLDDQMLDVNASTGVSVSSSTSILSVIEALLFKNNANTTAVSEQNMVHFSAFVDLAERAFFPTEQKQLGILKIPKVKEIFSADGTQLLDRIIHSQGDNTNNFSTGELQSESGPLDGLSNAQNLFLITKREFLSNIFKMLTGRPAFLADMPNQKVHVDEIATALCDVSSSQLLKLRTMVLQKYNSFEAAFQDLRYKEDQEEADGTKTARGQTGKNNTTSLGRNVELAKSAGIEIQEFVTRENLVKAYLELVHDRNLAEESATSTAPATPGGVDDKTQQQEQLFDGGDQDGFQVDGRSGSKSETKKKEINIGVDFEEEEEPELTKLEVNQILASAVPGSSAQDPEDLEDQRNQVIENLVETNKDSLKLSNCWAFHEDPYEDPAYRHLAARRRKVQDDEANALFEYAKCLSKMTHFSQRTETRKIDGIPKETWFHLLALSAPQVGVFVFRKRLLLKYGSWVQSLKNLLLFSSGEYLKQGGKKTTAASHSGKANTIETKRVVFTWRDQIVHENTSKAEQFIVGADPHLLPPVQEIEKLNFLNLTNRSMSKGDLGGAAEGDLKIDPAVEAQQNGLAPHLQKWQFFEVFGGALDMNRADCEGLFQYLLSTQMRSTSSSSGRNLKHQMAMSTNQYLQSFHQADGFDLEEFAIRLWAAKPPGIKVEQLLMQKLGLLAVEEEEERQMASSPKSILKQQAKKKFLDPRRPLLKTEFAAEIFGIYLTRGSRVSYEKKRMRSMRTGSSSLLKSTSDTADENTMLNAKTSSTKPGAAVGTSGHLGASSPTKAGLGSNKPATTQSKNLKSNMNKLRRAARAGAQAAMAASAQSPHVNEMTKSRDGPLVFTYPPLTGFEVSKLYDILREKKAGDLPTCHSLLRHLPTNVSDVLCMSQTKYHVGETAFLSYNLPRSAFLSSQNLTTRTSSNPKTATTAGTTGSATKYLTLYLACLSGSVVVSSQQEQIIPDTPAGYTVIPPQPTSKIHSSRIRSKVEIKKNEFDGLITMQCPPPNNSLEKVFSFAIIAEEASTHSNQDRVSEKYKDKNQFFQLIGEPVQYQIHGPKPGRPTIENVTPTSCELKWRPVHPTEQFNSKYFGPVTEYVVRAEPMVNVFEENTSTVGHSRFQIESKWNGKTQLCEPVCRFHVSNLTPGLPYRFSVLPRHRPVSNTGMMEAAGNSSMLLEDSLTSIPGLMNNNSDLFDSSLTLETGGLLQLPSGKSLSKAPSLGNLSSHSGSIPQPESIEGTASLASDIIIPPLRQRPQAPGRPEIIRISTEEATLRMPRSAVSGKSGGFSLGQGKEKVESFDDLVLEYCVAEENEMEVLLEEEKKVKKFNAGFLSGKKQLSDPFQKAHLTNPNTCTGWVQFPTGSLYHKIQGDYVLIKVKPVPENWLMHIVTKESEKVEDQGVVDGVRKDGLYDDPGEEFVVPAAAAQKGSKRNSKQAQIIAEEPAVEVVVPPTTPPANKSSKIILKAAVQSDIAGLSDFSELSLPRNTVHNSQEMGRIKFFHTDYEKAYSKLYLEIPDAHVSYDQVILDYQYEIQLWTDKGNEHPYCLADPDGTAADARKRIAFERDRNKEYSDPHRIRKFWNCLFSHVGTLPTAKSSCLPGNTTAGQQKSSNKYNGTRSRFYSSKKPQPTYSFSTDRYGNKIRTQNPIDETSPEFVAFSNFAELPQELQQNGTVLQGNLVLADVVLEHIGTKNSNSNINRELLETLIANHHDCYVSVKIRARFISGQPMPWSDNRLVKLPERMFSDSYAAKCLLISPVFTELAKQHAEKLSSGAKDASRTKFYEEIPNDKQALSVYLAGANLDANQRLQKAQNWEKIRARVASQLPKGGKGSKKKARAVAKQRLELDITEEAETMLVDTEMLLKRSLNVDQDPEHPLDPVLVQKLTKLCDSLESKDLFLDLVEKVVGGRAALAVKYGKLMIGSGAAPAPGKSAGKTGTTTTSQDQQTSVSQQGSKESNANEENNYESPGDEDEHTAVAEPHDEPEPATVGDTNNDHDEVVSQAEPTGIAIDENVKALVDEKLSKGQNHSDQVELHSELSAFLRSFGCLADVVEQQAQQGASPGASGEQPDKNKKSAGGAATPAQVLGKTWKSAVDSDALENNSATTNITKTTVNDDDLIDFGQKARAGLIGTTSSKTAKCRLRLDLFSDKDDNSTAQSLHACRLQLPYFEINLNDQAPFLLKNLQTIPELLTKDPVETTITKDIHSLLFEKYQLNDDYDNFDESKLASILDELLQLVLDPPTNFEDASDTEIDNKKNDLLNEGIVGDHDLLSTMVRVERFQKFIKFLKVDGLNWAYTFFNSLKQSADDDMSGIPKVEEMLALLNEVQGFGGLDKFFEFVHFFEDNNPGTRSMAASAKKDKKIEKDKSNYWDAVNFWNSFLTAPGPFQMLANGQIVPHPQAHMLKQDTKRHLLQHKQIAVQLLLHLDQCGTKPLLGFHTANIRPKLKKKQAAMMAKLQKQSQLQQAQAASSGGASSTPMKPAVVQQPAPEAVVPQQTSQNSELHKIMEKGRRGNVFWCGMARALEILTINAEMKLDHYVEAGKVLDYCHRELFQGKEEQMPLRDLMLLMEQGSLVKGGIRELALKVQKCKPKRVIPLLETLSEPRMMKLNDDYVRDALTLVLDTGGPTKCQETLRDAKLFMRQLSNGNCSLFEFEKASRFFGGGTDIVKSARYLEKFCSGYDHFPILKIVQLIGAIAPDVQQLPAMWDLLQQVQDVQIHEDWLKETTAAKSGKEVEFSPSQLLEKPFKVTDLKDYKHKTKVLVQRWERDRGKQVEEMKLAKDDEMEGEEGEQSGDHAGGDAAADDSANSTSIKPSVKDQHLFSSESQDNLPASIEQAFNGVEQVYDSSKAPPPTSSMTSNSTATKKKSALQSLLSLLKTEELRLTDLVIVLQFLRKNGFAFEDVVNNLQYMNLIVKLSKEELLPRDDYDTALEGEKQVELSPEQNSLHRILDHVFHKYNSHAHAQNQRHHASTNSIKTYKKFDEDLIQRLATVHWLNTFKLGEEIVRVTNCPDHAKFAETLSEQKFQFFLENAEELEEKFCGFTDSFRNCMKILKEMRLTGMRFLRMSLTDPIKDGMTAIYKGSGIANSKDRRSRLLSVSCMRDLKTGKLLTKNEQCRKLESISQIDDQNEAGRPLKDDDTVVEFLVPSEPSDAEQDLPDEAEPNNVLNGKFSQLQNIIERQFTLKNVEDHWTVWLEVIKGLNKTNRGPSFFTESVKGSDLAEFLFCVEALKTAQLLGGEQPGDLVDLDTELVSPRISSPRTEVKMGSGLLKPAGVEERRIKSSEEDFEEASFLPLTNDESEKFVSKAEWNSESIYPHQSSTLSPNAKKREPVLMALNNSDKKDGNTTKGTVKLNLNTATTTIDYMGPQTNVANSTSQNAASQNENASPLDSSSIQEHQGGRLGWQRVSRFSPLKALLNQLQLFGGSETFCWLLRGVPLESVKAQTLALQTLEGSPLITEEKERGLLVRLLELVEELGGLKKAITALQDEVEAENTFSRVQQSLQGFGAGGGDKSSGAGEKNAAGNNKDSKEKEKDQGSAGGDKKGSSGSASRSPSKEKDEKKNINAGGKKSPSKPSSPVQGAASPNLPKAVGLGAAGGASAEAVPVASATAVASSPAVKKATVVSPTDVSVVTATTPAGKEQGEEAGDSQLAGVLEHQEASVDPEADSSKTAPSKQQGDPSKLATTNNALQFTTRAKRKKQSVFFTALGERIADELQLDMHNEVQALHQAEALVTLYRALCGPSLQEIKQSAETLMQQKMQQEKDNQNGPGGNKDSHEKNKKESRLRKYQPVKWQNPNLHPPKELKANLKSLYGGGGANNGQQKKSSKETMKDNHTKDQDPHQDHQHAEVVAEEPEQPPPIQLTKLSHNEISAYQNLIREVGIWYKSANLARDPIVIPQSQLNSAQQQNTAFVPPNNTNMNYAKLLTKYLAFLNKIGAHTHDHSTLKLLEELFDFGQRVPMLKAVKMWLQLKQLFPQSTLEEWETLRMWMQRLGTHSASGERMLTVAPMVRLVSRVVETREGQLALQDAFNPLPEPESPAKVMAAGSGTAGAVENAGAADNSQQQASGADIIQLNIVKNKSSSSESQREHNPVRTNPQNNLLHPAATGSRIHSSSSSSGASRQSAGTANSRKTITPPEMANLGQDQILLMQEKDTQSAQQQAALIEQNSKDNEDQLMMFYAEDVEQKIAQEPGMVFPNMLNEMLGGDQPAGDGHQMSLPLDKNGLQQLSPIQENSLMSKKPKILLANPGEDPAFQHTRPKLLSPGLFFSDSRQLPHELMEMSSAGGGSFAAGGDKNFLHDSEQFFSPLEPPENYEQQLTTTTFSPTAQEGMEREKELLLLREGTTSNQEKDVETAAVHSSSKVGVENKSFTLPTLVPGPTSIKRAKSLKTRRPGASSATSSQMLTGGAAANHPGGSATSAVPPAHNMSGAVANKPPVAVPADLAVYDTKINAAASSSSPTAHANMVLLRNGTGPPMLHNSRNSQQDKDLPEGFIRKRRRDLNTMPKLQRE